MEIKIGKTYRWWLGNGFIRMGKVLMIDIDGIIKVQWQNGDTDYVRKDQWC